MTTNHVTRPFNGNALFVQFRDKGWWAVRHTESRYITFTPPARFPNAHRVNIMVPVTEPMSFELDPSRPFYGTITGTGDYKNLGVDFFVKADWNNPQKWTSFALWVADLVNNPAKFYDEAQ